MNSNTLRTLSLALLVSAAVPVAAAPAPVTELGGSSGSIERLERMLQARNQMQLDMQRQLDQMAGEIDQLRGTVERNSHELNQMLERQRDLYREIDSLRNAKPAPAVETSAETTDTKDSYSSNQSENAEYDAAVNLILKEKNYAGATDAFNAFLAKYPDSIYTPMRTTGWVSSISLRAILPLRKRTYCCKPSSEIQQTRRCLLKLGMIAEKEGDKAGANALFTQVVKEYPGTTTAKQAEKQLSQ